MKYRGEAELASDASSHGPDMVRRCLSSLIT